MCTFLKRFFSLGFADASTIFSSVLFKKLGPFIAKISRNFRDLKMVYFTKISYFATFIITQYFHFA